MICNSLVFIPVPLVVQNALLKQLQCNSQGQISSNKCILLHGGNAIWWGIAWTMFRVVFQCLAINILSLHLHQKMWSCIRQQCTIAGKKLTVATLTCKNG